MQPERQGKHREEQMSGRRVPFRRFLFKAQREKTSEKQDKRRLKKEEKLSIRFDLGNRKHEDASAKVNVEEERTERRFSNRTKDRKT